MGGEQAHRSDEGALTRLLCLVTRLAAGRPRMTLWCVLVSVLVCAGSAVLGLRFKTSRADLIDPEAGFHQRWLKFTDEFGDQSDMVVVVESDDPATVRRMLDELGEQLLLEPQLFQKVSWKFDPSGLQRKGLQYLSPTQLEQALVRLEVFEPILQGRWALAGLESYCRRLAVHTRWSQAQQRESEQQQAVAQSALLSQSLGAFSQLMMTAGRESSADAPPAAAGFVSPWPLIVSADAASASAALTTRYQVTADGRMGFVTAVATAGEQDFSGTSPAISRLKELLAIHRQQHPEVRFGLTGIPVLESDEMQRSQADMSQASLLSFAGVAVILLIGFRGVKHPLLGLVMLAIGLAWTIGYTTLVVGHLNILSVSFAAILIGLGIDFAIHYLAHYLELRHQGADLGQALQQTSATVGTGLSTAAVTTALAFLCAAFTQFVGVAELGIIAGGGILLCAAAAILVLPALIRLADAGLEPRKLATPLQGTILRWLTQRFPRSAAVLSGVCVLAVVLQAVGWRDGAPYLKVEYDSNLLNLQAADVESVQVQHRVFEATNGSLLYAVSLASDAEEARRRAEKFRALGSVAHVEHLADVMPSHAPAETALLVQAIHARLSQRKPPRDLPPVDPLAVGQAAEDLLTTIKSLGTAEAAATAARLDAFLSGLEQISLEQQVQLLNGYQSAMLTALQMQIERLAEVSDPVAITALDLPAGVRERFVSPRGTWLLRVFPREQVWDEAPLERFVQEVRSVDPEATGTPLQNYEAARQIRQSYLQAALYAFLAVCIVLLMDSLASGPLCVSLLTPLIVVAFAVVTLMPPDQVLDYRWLLCLYVAMAIAVAAIFDFQNVRNMALSLMPPVIGLAMLFGVLGFQGLHLNPANIIVLPLLLGIGVDYGVYVVHDFRGQSAGYRMSASTINAIVLTTLTSMVGFGSLMVASHRGLQSLGIVLVVGLGTSLFVALIVLPSLLTLISIRTTRSTASQTVPRGALDPFEAAPVLLALPPRAADGEAVGRTLRAAS